jgi:hypothetical protein
MITFIFSRELSKTFGRINNWRRVRANIDIRGHPNSDAPIIENECNAMIPNQEVVSSFRNVYREHYYLTIQPFLGAARYCLNSGGGKWAVIKPGVF